MRTIFLITIIALSLNAWGQKQKTTIDGDTIKVDGKPYAIIEKKSTLGCDYKIKSLDGKEIISFTFQEFNNPAKKTSGNPDGRVMYFEVVFFTEKGDKCEVSGEDVACTKKSIAKFLVQNNLTHLSLRRYKMTYYN